MTEAETKFAEMLKDAEFLLNKIKVKIHQDHGKINWGHVGSLSFVLDHLTQIDEFWN